METRFAAAVMVAAFSTGATCRLEAGTACMFEVWKRRHDSCARFRRWEDAFDEGRAGEGREEKFGELRRRVGGPFSCAV